MMEEETKQEEWKLIIHMEISGPYEITYPSEAAARASYERARRRAAFARYPMEVVRAD